MRYIILMMIAILMFLSRQAIAEDAASDAFTMTTNAFLDTGALPVAYTCDGKDISPDLTWTNAPKETKTFAIVLSDPDASGGIFYHWILFNIPGTTKSIDLGATTFPSGTLVGNNSWNKAQYNGPCPPKGTAHTYALTLYALDNKLSLPAGVDGKTFMLNMKDHVLQKVQLTMVYSRWLT